jgi:rubrerythrin
MITSGMLFKNISALRDDHIRHAEDLSTKITELGEKPPKLTQDFKGYLIEGFTSLRSVTGTKGALKAMESNEILTNRTYKRALELEGLPPDVKTLIEKNYGDEKRHLDYIRSAIKALE